MKKPVTNVVTGFFYGGEQGIRTLETALTVYTISNRAPSASSDNSPYGQMWCISVECENYYIRTFTEKQALFLISHSALPMLLWFNSTQEKIPCH